MNMLSAIPVWQALLGGALIGLSVAVYLLFAGRIAGISGLIEGAFGRSGRAVLNVIFLLALIGGAWIGAHLRPSGVAVHVTDSIPLLVTGGLLVGFGTRLGSGCTSGHGVCGMSRLSPRSIAATLIFVGTAALVATAMSALR